MTFEQKTAFHIGLQIKSSLRELSKAKTAKARQACYQELAVIKALAFGVFRISAVLTTDEFLEELEIIERGIFSPCELSNGVGTVIVYTLGVQLRYNKLGFEPIQQTK